MKRLFWWFLDWLADRALVLLASIEKRQAYKRRQEVREIEANEAASEYNEKLEEIKQSELTPEEIDEILKRMHIRLNDSLRTGK